MTSENMVPVFSALGDPVRMAIVERLLKDGETSAGDLAEPFAISKPAISRHLSVLEEAGLVERRTEKQYRMFTMKPDGLKSMADWLETYRQFWSASFDRLERILEELPPEGGLQKEPK